MTFDEFLYQEAGDAPVVTRIDPKLAPTPELRRARPEEEREPVDPEPHFPRVFPGI